MISLDFQNIEYGDLYLLHRLNQAIRQGVSSASPIVIEFEMAMADYLGVKEVLATNSGTSALHLALIGCGVSPGDKVALPVLTFAATASVIKYMGANPIFSDVDLDTWCILPQSFLEHFNAFKDKFIMPVDLYGNLVDLMKLECSKLILDSAESLGARGKNWANYTCYSFNGNKIMTTGAGGLLIGYNLDWLRELSTQAKLPGGCHFAVGYNYRMAGINAALGLSQLRKLPYFLERKRTINQIYKRELSSYLRFQLATPGTNPSWWMTAALWPFGTDINSTQKLLFGKGIPTRRIFRPLNQSEPFKDGRSYPVAEDIYNRGLCLPSSTLMTNEDVYEVCKILKEVCFG